MTLDPHHKFIDSLLKKRGITEEEWYRWNGGLYKVFLRAMTKEKDRLLEQVKYFGDDLKVSQIKLFKKRVDRITELQRLYSIKIKKNSRRELQVKRIFARYNV